MLDISIIVPIYKADRYLCRCIDSILAQTFKNFEVLLIDDGSPDNSGRICEEYAVKDTRVRVFHKKNGGVSSARQLGLDQARGVYTIHVDPDDWVEANMLEELYAKAVEDDADVVICDYYEEYYHGSRYVSQPIITRDPSAILRSILLRTIHGSLCNKLIRRACYLKYNIHFPLDISLWEDRYICCNMLLNNIKVTYINKAYYHYDNYSNESSLVRTNHANGIQSQKRFIQYFQEKLKEELYTEEFYTIKAETKDKAFVCTSYSKNDFIALYSEINSRYRKDGRNVLKARFYASLVLKLNNKIVPYSLYSFLLVFRSILYSLCHSWIRYEHRNDISIKSR